MFDTSTELGNALGLGLTAAAVGLGTGALEHLPAAQALAGGPRRNLGVGIAAVASAAAIVMQGLRHGEPT